MDTTEENKLLIRKYIDKKCSAFELAELKRRMSVEDLSGLFSEVMDEVAPEPTPLADKVNTDQALMRFHQRVQHDENNSPRIVSLENVNAKPNYRKYFSYAASILILCTATYFLLSKSSTKQQVPLAYQHFINPNGKRTQITLPDSSTVYLGAGSEISYPEEFSGNTRELKLKGEAFFQVKKKPRKPFIIHTGNVSTRVLGTSFKVEAFKNKPISVLVSTGKVRVDRTIKNKLQPIAVLLPGDYVTWDELKLKSIKGIVPVTDVENWKAGRLVFRSAELQEITEVLERWYDMDIHINTQKLAKRMVRVNLTTNISIDKVMKILSLSGNFKYKINQQQITIY